IPVISGVFQQGDDVTALRQVRTEGSIEKMRAAGTMGNHNERELAFGDSRIRADVDGIRPKRSRRGRYAGRIQDQGWKRDALGLWRYASRKVCTQYVVTASWRGPSIPRIPNTRSVRSTM